MVELFAEAESVCKTILRNGFDAYVINTPLQQIIFDKSGRREVDIATEMHLDDLMKIFQEALPSREPDVVASMKSEAGILFRFYPADIHDGSHPEASVAKLTPRMLRDLEAAEGVTQSLACAYMPKAMESDEGFEDFHSGTVAFAGLPDETLKRNYLLGIRALRFAANYGLPVEANSWMAIVRGATAIVDCVSITHIMDEWRKVEPENMAQFVRHLFDTMILHGILPEVAALSRVKQIRKGGDDEETVLEHTLTTMACYPEELPFDWYGTIACLFHGVGKLYTGEYYAGRWNFHQYHCVGAKVTRKLLQRLRFGPQDVEIICHLVRHHHHFDYMLTERGVRRFKALDDYPRLIEVARARIKASGAAYTEFNHNLKIMELAAIPEEMREPLLNGKEIMEFTGLAPSPAVGLIREALLKAQIAGEIQSIPDAVEFVQRYKDREKLH
ncbi:MAG: HD domain-containing protein [Desulfovibrionaceae bacterium]